MFMDTPEINIGANIKKTIQLTCENYLHENKEIYRRIEKRVRNSYHLVALMTEKICT